MKKRGFTLVELLAVIVILAIIAVIAVPIVLNVISKSKKGAAIDSAYSYVDAVEKYIVMHDMDESKYPINLKSNETYQVSNSAYNETSFLNLIEKVYAEDSIILNDIISIKGTKPSKGIVTISEKRKVGKAILIIGDYKITCEKGKCVAKSITITEPPTLEIRNVRKTPNKIIIEYITDGEAQCLYGEDYEYGGTINNNTCILNNLETNTSYKYKIISSNKIGDTEETGTAKTLVTPSINITVSNPNTYEQTKTITITGSSEGSILQYRIGNGEWVTYNNPFEVDDNVNIVARLYNETINEEVATKTETVSNIDRTPPTLEIGTVTSDSSSITIPYTSEDNESGISEVKVEYGTTNSLGNSIACTDNKCRIIGLNSETTYYYKVTSKNVVSSETTSEVLSIATRKQEPLVTTLLSKTNNASITAYTDGNTGEMYTFSHPATTQIEALTDYRYIGNAPNNYITFNNETWRIIGVFTVDGEQRVKIIRDTSIGNMAWASDSTNEWPNGSLDTYLNGTYKSSLTATAQNQIASSTWYLGGINTSKTSSAEASYSAEHGTSVWSGRSTSTQNYIGLVYLSDYLYTYANGVNNSCFSKGNYCSGMSSSWFSITEWTIVPIPEATNCCPNTSRYSNLISNGGAVSSTYATTGYPVRPTLYLKSTVMYKSGDGSSGNPYIIE